MTAPATISDRAALVRQRRAARSNAHSYIEYMMRAGHPDFQYEPAMHHWVMIAAFERLMNDPDIDTVVVLAPRGSAKSTYFSVMLTTFALIVNPRMKILACSNTTDLAEGFNRRRRSVVMTKAWQRLSGARIDPDNKGVGEWSLLVDDTPGGAVRAGGVGSSIVGFRADLLLLDDPIKSAEEANSQTILAKHWDWWTKDAQPCLLPTGKTVVVSTRWAANDIPGRIIKEAAQDDGILVVRMPMECDDPDNDPLGRGMGEPLWPEWYTDKQLAKGRKDARNWSCMYQQKPLDEEGAWLSAADLPLVDRQRLPPVNIFFTSDLAMTVGAGDFSVIGVFGLAADRTLYLIDVWRDRVSPDEVAAAYFRLFQQWSPSAIYLEDDTAFKVFKRLLMVLAREKNVPLPLRVLPIRGKDKETRAAAFRGFAMSGRVRLVQDDWTYIVLDEVNEFPAGAHDDCVDVLGMAGRVLAEQPPPMSATQPATPKNDLVEKDGVIYLSNAMSDVWDRPAQQSEFDRI